MSSGYQPSRRETSRWLREQAKEMVQRAEEFETGRLPDIRRVGISYGGLGALIEIGEYKFKVGRDDEQFEEFVRNVLWAFYETHKGGRDGALARQHVLQLLSAMLDPRPRESCARCGGLTMVCVACESECKVPLAERKGDHWRTKTCLDCSAFLVPEPLDR